MMWFELVLLIACIVLGARLGGIGLGAAGGIGLVILVFGLGMPPGSPPSIVLGMIIAVITALAAMQAAGGLDFLVSLASKLMAKKPQYITFVAPFVTYLLVFASGTQHVIYALMPVIVEVSAKADIRPERPLSMSVIASQGGLIASPISAASVAMLAAVASLHVTMVQILMVIAPATLLGVFVGTLSVAWRGKKLSEDPVFQEKVKHGQVNLAATELTFSGEKLRNARGSLAIFLLAILVVVVLGIFPQLRPHYQVFAEGHTEMGQVETGQAIMIVMLAASGLIMLLFKAKPDETVKNSIMKGGIVAVISILGVSWMGSSFFEGNRPEIVAGISEIVRQTPWVLALGLFVLSILLISQAATVVTLMPVAVAMGLPASVLVGMFPAVNGSFFLPTYGTVLAAVSFDQTGSTRIGKYLLNHSFMRPGLVTTIASTLFALLIGSIVL
jgi:anaerobic C4-dicarboxylate transporter-like protein